MRRHLLSAAVPASHGSPVGLKIHYLLCAALLVFVLVLSSDPASAQTSDSGSISVSGEVDRKTITIGDNILYTVTVVHPQGVTVEMPPFASNLGSFEIKDYRRPEREIESGRVTEKAEYVISTFTTGKYTIPPVVIAFLNPTGETSRLSTEEIEIEVQSVVATDADLTDVRNLKDPVDIPSQELPKWAKWAIGISILGIMIGFVWWLRRREGFVEEIIVVPVPPHEAALMGLDRLEGMNLPGKGQIREFYYELSDILRRYLCALTPGASMDLVTFELCDAVASGPLSGYSEKLAEWMGNHDFAKFAKAEPPSEECGADISNVRNFVNETAFLVSVAEAAETPGEAPEDEEPLPTPPDGPGEEPTGGLS